MIDPSSKTALLNEALIKGMLIGDSSIETGVSPIESGVAPIERCASPIETATFTPISSRFVINLFVHLLGCP